MTKDYTATLETILQELEEAQKDLRASLEDRDREIEILENACTFWKQEAIDLGYKE